MASVRAHGQETVSSIEISGTPPVQSYIVTLQGKILPGTTISGAAGSFSLKAINTNPPVFPDKNYTCVETIHVSGVINEPQIAGLPTGSKIVSYSYVDDMGRKKQDVVAEGSPTLNDAVTIYEYDGYGRQVNSYQPFTKFNSIKGGFLKNGLTEQLSFYLSPPASVTKDERPFTENSFESSPLGRTYQTFGAGKAWKDDGKASYIYTNINVANEVLRWDDFVSGFPSLSSSNSGYYPFNTLTVTKSTNEDGQSSQIYQNGREQKVMSRATSGGTNLDTYYIYNPAGLLMFVIQPEGVARLNTEYFASGADKQSFLDRWTFQYQYDNEQRMIAKRIPGSEAGVAGWSYIVYDQWNREVLTQDPVQRTRNEYTFTKYDRFNRPIMAGIYTTTTALATLRTQADAAAVRFETEAASTATGYTLTSAYPTGIAESNLLSVSYYDNYSFLYSGWDAEGNTYAYTNISGFPQKTSDAASEIMVSVKGYKTGAKTRILNSTKWLNSVTHYDKKYRAVQTITETHLGGIARATTKLSFTGKTEKTDYYNSYSNLTINQNYTYDHGLRLLTVSHSINGATPVIIKSNRYNELGQLIEENFHSTDNGVTFLQSTDKRYNIRGWLTTINNSTLATESGDINPDLFGMEIQYNPTTTSSIAGGAFTTKKIYSGNISAIKWKTDNRKDTPVEKIYGYDYDGINRLKKAYYAANNAGSWTGEGGMYDEEIKTYDLNGNIKGIARSGKSQEAKVLIDDLTFGYALNGKESNRLVSLNDTGNSLGFKDAAANVTEEYLYDKNGNLIFDHNKAISQVQYNNLNLPTIVEFTRPNATIDRIEYTYDANGAKLKKVVKVNGTLVWTTDYLGGLQYDNGQLSFVSTAEGRAVVNNGAFEYEYFFRDHLNNTRVVYGALKETKSYRATMETQLATDEEDPLKEGFKNVNARRINPGNVALNYTRSSEKVLTPDKAARCNANAGQSIGPAKSLRVLTGDAVYMEVYAKYTQPTASSAVITAAVLGAAVNSAFGIVNAGETATLYSGLNSNAAVAAGAIPAGTVQPKAYLVYLFFDDNFVYQRSGAVGITTSAYNAFEKLSRSFTADKNGYVYIYVASESNVSVANVYFDELYVVHQKATSTLQVTQTTDYYPFGLSFNEFQSDRLKVSSTTPSTSYEPMLRNRYLFQGKEIQRDHDLNWYSLDARMYEAAAGRFLSIDPLAESDHNQTPYHYVLNNPALLIDPAGTHWSYNPTNYNAAEMQLGNMQGRMFEGYMGQQLIAVSVGNIMKGTPTSVTEMQIYAQYKGLPSEMISAAVSNARRNGSLLPQAPDFGKGNTGSYSNLPLDYMNTFAQATETAFPFLGSLSRMGMAAASGDAGGVARNGILYGIQGAVAPIASELAISRLTSFLMPSSTSTNLYRAVFSEELNDISTIGGFRNVGGYVTGKLFATSAQDAGNYGRILYHFEKQPFTVVQTSIPNKYFPELFIGAMDEMKAVSVPNGLLPSLSQPTIMSSTFLPNHPWAMPSFYSSGFSYYNTAP
jgi:RHS repeat-associated protein